MQSAFTVILKFQSPEIIPLHVLLQLENYNIIFSQFLENMSDKVSSLSYNAELIHCVMRFSMYFITFKEYTLIAILS